jgi:hypothetical protein
MSNDEQRRTRDLELLRKSYRALESDQDEAPTDAPGGDDGDQSPGHDPDQRDDPPTAPAGDEGNQPPDDDGAVLMYRGRPVRTRRPASLAPGAGGTGPPRTYRGASGRGGRERRPEGGGQGLEAALTKLLELRKAGLVTEAEYAAKRQEILDRL